MSVRNLGRLAFSSAAVLGAGAFGGCSADSDVEAEPVSSQSEALETLGAQADAHVRDGSYATQNFGKSSTLEVDQSPVEQGFLRFQVPAGGAVTQATLRLFCSNGSGDAAEIFTTTSASWDENTVTWNTRPALNPTAIATIGEAVAGTWIEVDVTAAVKAGSVVSLGLTGGSSNGFGFNSREASSNRPELVLQRVVCGNGTCEAGETCSSCQNDCGVCAGGGCTPVPQPTDGGTTTTGGAGGTSGTGGTGGTTGGTAGSAGVSCLKTASSIEKAASGTAEYAYDSAGIAVDARTVVWTDIAGHAIQLDGDSAACWSGGTIDGPYPEDAVYECSSEHCPNADCPDPCWPYHVTAGISQGVAAPTVVEDVRIADYGDGVSAEESADRQPFEVRRAYMYGIHDDAVENDWGASVTVVDSLLEEVFMAFASRPRSGEDIDASDRVFTIRNNLVRLHRFTNTYKQKPGHGGFYKWPHDGRGPKFAVTGNVFVASDLGSGQLLFPLVNQVVECKDNKILWAGSSAAWQAALATGDDSDGLDNGGRLAALAYCFTAIVKPDNQSTADFLAQHWEPLVATWKATHSAGGQ